MNRLILRTLWTCVTLASAAAGVEANNEPPLADKTLVVWASPANLTQAGGSALTVNDTTIDRFDGVVFGELAPQVWMPGNTGSPRSSKGRWKKL